MQKADMHNKYSKNRFGYRVYKMCITTSNTIRPTYRLKVLNLHADWDQHHITLHCMYLYVQTDRQRSRLLLAAPHGSSSTQHTSQYESCSGTSPLLPSFPVSLPVSLYLSNPLRLDPTPPTAPPQSVNPIRTHTAS